MRDLDIVSLGEPMIEFCSTSMGPLKEVKYLERGWGGDTSNVVVAAARLGRRCGYICRIGDDEFGKSFLGMWRHENIDTSHVIVEKGSFTAVYFISIMDGGKHDFTYYRAGSAASHLTPKDIDPDYVRRARIFHSSGISQAISPTCKEAVFKAAETAKKSGILFSYDPNIRLKLWPLTAAREVVSSTLEMADIALPNMDDAEIVTGHSSPENAAKAILKKGPSVVALKLGAEGCLAMTSEKAVKVPGFNVSVVDTTGAGDAFDGAFLVGLIEELPIEKAAQLANATAALKTLGRGAVSPLPRKEKVTEFLQKTRGQDNNIDFSEKACS